MILGSGVQGTIDRGAGQAYLTWQAGRWSVTVHASPVMGQDPVAMSKQLVALFNQYSLPIPSQVGAGNFDVTDNGLNQTITWQEGAILYKISARSAETAIKMASSMSRYSSGLRLTKAAIISRRSSNEESIYNNHD